MNFQRFNQLLRMGVNPQAADRESSLYKGGGGKTVTSSTQTSTPYQQTQYNTLLGKADAWQGFDQNYGGSANFDGSADLNANQNAAIGGSVATGTALNQLYSGQGNQALQDYLGPYDPNKTGLTGAIDAANSRSNYNFETTQTGAIRQGATDSGQYGGTRHGIAEGLARGQLAQAQSDNAQQLAFQDQQNFNTNRVNTLNNLSGITTGLNSGNALVGSAGQTQQNQAQSEINADLQKWAYENNVSLNDALAYQQLVSGDMGGTQTGTSTQKGGGGGGSSPWAAIGTIGGAVLGSMVGMPTVGAAAGGALGGAMS